MFGAYSSSVVQSDSLTPTSYSQQIRAAHALADLLKRTRPHLCDQVEALQATICQCQSTLDQSKDQLQEATQCSEQDGRSVHDSPALSAETQEALRELEEAMQALLDLRHKGGMAR